MATAVQLFEDYKAGKITLQQLADDFRGRDWTTTPAPTDAQRWGTDDKPDPGDDEWEAIEIDPRLTDEEYDVLSDAYLGEG